MGGKVKMETGQKLGLVLFTIGISVIIILLKGV